VGCATHPSAHKSGTAAARQQVCTPGSYEVYGTAQVAYAGVVRSRAVALRSPDGGSLIARFGRIYQNGFPTVLGIFGARVDGSCAPVWFHVQLPMKPNGITGWVRASDLVLGSVNTRIVVDKSARRLTFFRGGRPVLTTRVAVGAPSSPTPAGRYYVDQKLIPSDPQGPYGPAAIGISAFSNVLTGWAQGGPIGIHGTDEPSSIGHNVSNGCIRLPNAVIKRLFPQVIAGTPVIIHP
jgi:lipoprotein-anchoring transpeptidase ErfK/SrfK